MTESSTSSSGSEAIEAKLLDFPPESKAAGTSNSSNLGGTIDRLLERQKQELMTELRRMQHGDRPVTGQGSKEAVESFFQRAMGVDTNLPEPAESRPEHVVVEVNALIERRPVSSVLQGSGFRRNLENALRGALTNITRQPLVRPRQTSTAPIARSEERDTSSQSNVQRSDQRTNHPIPAPRVSRSAIVIPPPQALGTPRRNEDRISRETQNPVVHPAREHQQNVTGRDAFAQEWLQRQQQNNFNAGIPVHMWETIEEVQRDNLVADISELVHRQLVTNTLTGNFRHSLEARMQDRLSTIDTDGERVQEFVRSIPRTYVHVRNDFSELGIQEAIQEALSDEVSVVSAAVAVPYAQSNMAMSRELNALKAQLKEMKNMMKLQFDLTLDIQRSVRQEVAAAMNQNQGIQIQPTVASRPVNDTQCLICLDKTVDTVLYRCGHMCVCLGCGMNLQQRGSNCPVCRAPIQDIVRAYKCNSE